jgi:histidinol dehydrogenase
MNEWKKSYRSLELTFKGLENKMQDMIEVKVLRTADANFEDSFKKILLRIKKVNADVESIVKDILQEIKENGDKALFSYTEKYDRIKLDSSTLMVTREEIESAYKSLDSEEIDALSLAANRIEQFHKKQIKQLSTVEIEGEIVADIVRPLQRVGLYIPGGKAAYPSSVLMTAVPARVAGVKDIIMVSPTVSSHVLAAAKIAGLSCIYRIGGAQAVAALAYGTESIPRVDKIVGPGNVYVETAKRMVFGDVGLDMVAGPSEVLIIADESGVPSFAAADLLAQAEHDEDACPMLIATSEDFIKEVKKEIFFQIEKLDRKKIARRSIEKRGIMILADNISEAVALANRIAPEHLELMVDKPNELLKKVTSAGAIFLGNYSPVAVGDYIAGPSHVLPTGGTARFFSPLGVEDFVKRMSVISFRKDTLLKLGNEVRKLALMEGLDAHAKAVEKRMNT